MDILFLDRSSVCYRALLRVENLKITNRSSTIAYIFSLPALWGCLNNCFLCMLTNIISRNLWSALVCLTPLPIPSPCFSFSLDSLPLSLHPPPCLSPFSFRFSICLPYNFSQCQLRPDIWFRAASSRIDRECDRRLNVRRKNTGGKVVLLKSLSRKKR